MLNSCCDKWEFRLKGGRLPEVTAGVTATRPGNPSIESRCMEQSHPTFSLFPFPLFLYLSFRLSHFAIYLLIYQACYVMNLVTIPTDFMPVLIV